MIAPLVDDALEISVIGSFSRIGPAVRRRLFRWQDRPAGALAGRTVLVTGPTSGLGLSVTREMAALGARVVLVGRSEERLSRLRDELVGLHGEDRFPVVVADMGSLASVRAAVARILETEPRLDVRRRQRRGDLPGADRGTRRDRGDPRRSSSSVRSPSSTGCGRSWSGRLLRA